MALVASIVAYLGVVIGIIVGFLMTFDEFVYSPSQSAVPRHVVVAVARPPVKLTGPKPGARRWGPAVIHRGDVAVVAHQPENHVEARRGDVAAVVHQPENHAEARRKPGLASNAVRQQQLALRLEQQARTGVSAFQPAPQVQVGALGYAAEPPSGLGRYW